MVENTQWEAIFRKILKKTPGSKLPLEKACLKAANRAGCKQGQDKQSLKAEAKTYIKQLSANSYFVLEHNHIRLLTAPSKPEDLDGRDTAIQQDQKHHAKKRKLSESKTQMIDSQASPPPATPQTTVQRKGRFADVSAWPDGVLEAPTKGLGELKDTLEQADSYLEGTTKQQKAAAGLSNAGMPPIRSELAWRESRDRKNIKHGRFSEAEKTALRDGVAAYAREKGLSETDLSWLFKTSTGAQRELTRGAWKAIASECLPHRSIRAVHACGTRMLDPCNYKGTWTEEETNRLTELVEAKGKKWKDIGEELGRIPTACRDRFREVDTRTEVHRNGKWSLEECGLLQQAVEGYLAIKQEMEEKLSPKQTATLSLEDVPSPVKQPGNGKEDGRMLLDDIDWAHVASKVGTRSRVQCMSKWYHYLAPSMVAQGDWGNGDDRRLLRGLLATDARQMFLVPWSKMVKGRTAQQAKRRWNLMVKRVPDFNEKEFPEQLDYIVKTFAPGLKKPLDSSVSEEG